MLLVTDYVKAVCKMNIALTNWLSLTEYSTPTKKFLLRDALLGPLQVFSNMVRYRFILIKIFLRLNLSDFY
jgi:hypothetical protein